MVAALLAVTTGAMMLGSAAVARHRAQAAADLAALSAAVRLPDGPDAACTAAKSVTESMNALLIGCEVDDLDVVVRAGVTVGVRIPGGGPAQAIARAGP
jgi:secretion/DNA translocation related TadE-like protein